MAQPSPLLVEQQDGAQDSAELRFDEPRQLVEDRLERRAHGNHLENLRLAVAQQIGKAPVGDVARDAGDAEDVAARVAHRHLGRQEPGLGPGGVVDVFLDVDHRPAIADDLLFVVEELLRDLQRQQLDVAFADHVSGFGMAHARRRDLVADDETTLDVLDPEVVVEAIDQGLQRNALVEPGALVAQFGDVFVSRNPTAAGKRLPPDRDRPAVGQFVAPFARLFVETHRRAKHQIVADFKRQGSSREAQIDDRTPRGARLQTFRIEPIKIGIAAVAERQARLAVENADPLRQRFDRGVQAAGFLVEAVDLRFLPARGGLLSVVGGAQQAREGGIADRSLVGAGLSFRAHSKTSPNHKAAFTAARSIPAKALEQ